MPRIEPPKPEIDPNYEFTVKLLNSFKNHWVSSKPSDMDHVQYYRLSVVAFTQLGAMIAVDVGMKPEQFTAMCNANFKEAYQRAPKFS